MDKELKKLFIVFSILLAAAVLLWLLLSGYDLSAIQVHKGIRIGS